MSYDDLLVEFGKLKIKFNDISADIQEYKTRLSLLSEEVWGNDMDLSITELIANIEGSLNKVSNELHNNDTSVIKSLIAIESIIQSKRYGE